MSDMYLVVVVVVKCLIVQEDRLAAYFRKAFTYGT